ncbi:RNA-binding protein 12 [Drosophila teissieri]|uniref:RNA-binding protein 12 n=1 Tax=Drosophila teissieri TaxID=7243 RepID=UPI001CB9F736|nr:RNA-binding protein 12 [Drosophila teissieri]
MFKPHYHLAAVLLCFVFATAQVVPNAEIGRITIQVPLLSNGKPVILANQEREEVATVEEIKPGKVHVVQEVVVPPTVKSDNKLRVARSVSDSGIPNHGIPNPGIPNHGIPNRGIPNDGIPNPGIPNHGIPNPGIPNHGIPNRGIPNDGIPNPGIPNHGIPNPGIPNDGIPNPGIPNPAASELMPVVAMPSSRTTSAPASTSMPKRVPTRNCFHLLMGGIATTSPADMMTPPPTENCDELCTKFEYSPICAHNGICIHEFANQCVMNTFNCKHRDLSFRAVDEDVCRLGVCMRRCKEEELTL